MRSTWVCGIGAAIVAGVTTASAADVWYVDSSRPQSGDYTSWDEAARYLQDVLKHANLSPGDEIWVAAGVYLPDRNTEDVIGTNDPNDAFDLASGVAVYGGFPPGGGDGTFAARDPSTHVTILSGLIADDSGGQPMSACLPPDPHAGNCLQPTPGVVGCVDPSCCAVACEVFPLCCIIEWSTQCTQVAEEVCWNGNARTVVTAVGVSPSTRIDGFTIMSGSATGPPIVYEYIGGGMEINGSPVISNCIFTNNTGELGAAVGVTGGSPTFINCAFRANEGGNGGAVYAQANCAPRFVNCLFESNYASGGIGAYEGVGGAVYALPGNGTSLVNCTLIDNLAISGDGGATHGAPTIVNSILWSNGVQPIVDADTVAYSCLQFAQEGPGNITSFPLFVDVLNDDYRLAAGSPCINAARSEDLPGDLADLDGDGDVLEPTPQDFSGLARIVGSTVDIGAWEFCPYDVDLDGAVGVLDFIGLLDAWGSPGALDYDQSGAVDTPDMLELLWHWGGC